MDGIGLLRVLSLADNAPDVVLMTAYGSIASAVEATKLGAYEYVEKPFQAERLETTIRRVAEMRALRTQNLLLRFRLESADAASGICGASKKMLAVCESILRVAGRPQPVLITGETGTGKELIARAIHEHGQRGGAQRPFVAVDCAALSGGIAESELFGHVRGAYTGALGDRRGLLESSAGGTLFLDEIGELPLALQVKFLRVLQDRDFRPLGSDVVRRFEGRVLAATNRDLEKAVAAGEFRADLYYRLNVHAIHVPPLRERRSDIPLLIQHFIRKHGEGRVLAITREASETLEGRGWPGNVRELENCMIRMVAICDERVLDSDDIPPTLRMPSNPSFPVGKALEEAERAVIAAALTGAGGNVAKAAVGLGVSIATLYRKMASHGLKREQSRAASASGGDQ
jgi:DNA-binding NtrC family response regulator